MPRLQFTPHTTHSPKAPLAPTACYHCGDVCETDHITLGEKVFCCQGCKTVYELLQENDLCTYYDLEHNPGITLKSRKDEQAFAYLDNEEVITKLLDYQDEQLARVSLYLPQVHCASCIWLLENLYKLEEGISQSRVDFLKKEIHLSYQPHSISLKEIVQLLATLGYEPEINLYDLQDAHKRKQNHAFFYRLGLAGFAFGNIMLMSFPEYLGLDATEFPQFSQFFGYLNLLLALPVVFFSAAPFFKAAFAGLTKRFLNIDVPISLGIIALFGRSAFEILTHTGAGYMDSLAGLVFFLLVGRWFQNKTYDRLAFDRDYQAYFPISTTKVHAGKEESVPITDLSAGDTIVIRNQELIPADALLLSSEAHIDYSFVTGEAEPVRRVSGDLIYAGGRQVGKAIELTLVKDVSQSYLTQLWNDDAFAKSSQSRLTAFVDRMGQRFTLIVLSIATLAAGYWLIADSLEMAINVFTAVLIVACPCALALTAPITLGNAMRILGRIGCYLKHTHVLEQMAEITHIVFDKTGTLTYKHQQITASIEGELSSLEKVYVRSLVRQSTHPVSRSISRLLGEGEVLPVATFLEIPGKGLQGTVEGYFLKIGNWEFISEDLEEKDGENRSDTWLSIDRHVKVRFTLPQVFRRGLPGLLKQIAQQLNLSLVSGDNDRQRQDLLDIFPAQTEMRFQQQPQDKLDYIRGLQQQDQQVMMVGDGLNDAGALKISELGVAVSENVDTFSPACDIILDAKEFHQLGNILQYGRQSMKLVKGGLVLSLVYNLIGLSFAIQGLLSPLIAAILMPLSSVTIVVYGLLVTEYTARKLGLTRQKEPFS